MMTRRHSLSILLASMVLSSGVLQAQAPKPAAAGRTIEIKATDTMQYSVTSIQAKRGEQLTVKLISTGTMPKIAMSHNFVLLKKAADPQAFVNAAATARATDFIPPAMKEQVLATTKLGGNGETVEVSFKAPTVPGTYTYLCTFPGHFAVGMKGTLVVK